MTKQDIYSDLYRQGEEVLRDNNPCKVINGKCLSREGFCCRGCEHLGPSGCTVESLACKLWLCYEARCTPDGIRASRQFGILGRIAQEQRVPMVFRGSKEKNFEVTT